MINLEAAIISAREEIDAIRNTRDDSVYYMLEDLNCLLFDIEIAYKQLSFMNNSKNKD